MQEFIIRASITSAGGSKTSAVRHVTQATSAKSTAHHVFYYWYCHMSVV